MAVYAVHSYLQWLACKTDLSQSDSWQPGLIALSNVADLVLPGVGKLECCPLLPGETSFIVPPQATEDRIGYVAVQFGESLDEVQLLGFISAVDAAKQQKQLQLADLQLLDVLLDCIPDGVKHSSAVTSKTPVNLRRWLENTFETGWQTVEALFSTQAANFALSVRSDGQLREVNMGPASSVKRGKLFDLGIQLAANSVALIVTITSVADEEVDIRIQVYPAGGQIYLPPSLQLIVLDETGAAFPELQSTARSADSCIQLEFDGQLGEQFSVQLALGSVSISEDFLL